MVAVFTSGNVTPLKVNNNSKTDTPHTTELNNSTL